jgi:uncharacterized membrane protein YdfJ with MMPL/SSD domain
MSLSPPETFSHSVDVFDIFPPSLPTALVPDTTRGPITRNSSLKMKKDDVEKVERVDSIDAQKVPSTAYVADTNGDSHHKSVAERKLVLKADLLIVPFAALIYFVAYLVCPNFN